MQAELKVMAIYKKGLSRYCLCPLKETLFSMLTVVQVKKHHLLCLKDVTDRQMLVCI